MRKRAQAAMEFLMTYGWAILVVLVVIGALAYFGVLNPGNLFPEKCTLPMGLYCRDYRIDEENNQIRVKIENSRGTGMIFTSITASGDVIVGCNAEEITSSKAECEASTDKGDCYFNNVPGWRLGNGQSGTIYLYCDSISGYNGKTKVDITFTYCDDTSSIEGDCDVFSHTLKGELLARVESDDGGSEPGTPCTPSPEICNNNIDDDCDGLIDCSDPYCSGNPACPACAGTVFSDGFESGDLSAWSSNVNDGGDLSASADAKIHGSYGLSCFIDDDTDIYVEDTTPSSETRYRVRFYFDPNGIAMDDGDIFVIATTYSSEWTDAFRVHLYKVGSDYTIGCDDATDAQDFSKVTSSYTITDEPHYIEVDWKASTGDGNNDGYLELYIDGVLKETLSDIDSDTLNINRIRLGQAASLWMPGTSGTIHFDDFVSNNDGSPLPLEDCDNNIDDDCDGLIDCYDPDCCSDPICSSDPACEDVVYTKKWSGLGITLFHTYITSEFDSYVDDLLANGFDVIRVGSPDWTDEWNSIDRAKAAVLRAQAKGAKVCWGVTQSFTITAENWPQFRQAILDAAQWAQNNGVYEFKLGNEEEWHIDGTTMTVPQIIANIKDVATDVQEIYTIGEVSYSCAQGHIDDWIAAGKGDIDLLTSNIYMGGEYDSYDDDWKLRIDKLVDAFGPSGTYLTEFGPSYTSLEHYSTDEAVQAAAVTEMIEYIKASGMEKAFYFCYIDTDWLTGFGARNYPGNLGTYKLLWEESLLNSD
ncbi:MAG: hypothetical protein PHV16_01765 [Candidatus Nanoarchaeia archaeon]|nr:hypothetical protein [Candidatus Nanoarchaeia archaeon]